MAFIKRHLMLLSCGLLGLLSLAAIVVGILVGDVSGEMQQAESLYKKLAGMGRDCVNNEHIKLAEEKSQRIAADYQKAMQIVKTMNARPPIRDGVFPMPQRASDAYSFKDAYRVAVDNLLPNVLKAKTPPTTDEVRRMQGLIAKERADAIKKGQIPPGTLGSSGTAAGGTGSKPPGAGKPVPPTIEELARTDADVRMSLVRAHETLCYAVPQSLQICTNLLDNRDVPDPEQMWDAQMSLWIQQDVLGALAKLNEATAAKLKPEDRWVAHMPVKEFVGIRVGDYVLGQGAAEAAGAASNAKWVEAGPDLIAPPGDASAVFTGRKSDELADVIQFAVELVIDARELPAVLDAICGANFFTPLTVSCSSPTIVPSFRGKVYGPDPVLRVRIELEGCFLRDFYHYYDGQNGKDGKPEKPFMPPSLREQIVKGQRTSRDKASSGMMRPGR